MFRELRACDMMIKMPIAIFLCLLVIAGAAFADNEQSTYDKYGGYQGKIVYQQREDQVYDKHGNFLGKADKNGTYDRQGSLISRQRVPGILIGIEIEEDQNKHEITRTPFSPR